MSTTLGSATQRHLHASGLHAVASALDDLHRDALREAGAESTQVRLSVVNVIAACSDAARVPEAIETVVAVAERHPARAIVINADHNRPAMIESDIALRQSPAGGYVELVTIEVGGEPALHLTSIVQPLLIPDIPVQLWLVGSPPLDQAFRPDAVALVDRLILDSDEYEDAAGTLRLISGGLAAYPALTLSDMTWERMRTWREAIAHAFNGPAMRPWLTRITGVDIISADVRAQAQARLLAAWLASSLNWPHHAGPEVELREVPVPGCTPGELVHVRIRCADGKHTARVDLRRRAGMLRISLDVDRGVDTTSVTLSPPEPEAMLLARLMAEVEDDDVYRETVAHVAEVVFDA
jgi:glucose-6-phosphate dehydrogenase assembly protein OpcA